MGADEQEFVLLYNAYKSTNPDFPPNWNYERFDLVEKTMTNARPSFVEHRKDIYNVAEQRQVLDEITKKNRQKVKDIYVKNIFLM